MLQFQRACYAMLLVALFPAPGAAQRTPESLSGDPRVAWLKENVLPIRSIDPADEDFRDLEPLRATLDGVRLVLLGEANHGSGSDFHAKTRLVKFLHQELGFDVVAFESPIYDMMVMWDRLRAGAPPRDAFFLGTVTWAGVIQTQPLVAYLAEQARGARPLELAGFDHHGQFASGFYFTEDLARFLSQRGLGGPLVDSESPEYGVLQGLVEGLYPLRVIPLPDRSAVLSFASALRSATTAVGAMRDDEARQWTQILKSLDCTMRFVDAGWWQGQFGLGACNRDEQMAKNLLWLANERYPNRKIIVWSATLHAARIARMSDFRVSDRRGGSDPSMGQHIGEAFGSKSYVIGVTSYSGSSGSEAGRTEIVTDQHPEPELEELMVAAGFDYGFLDLRRAAAEGSWAGGEFLARPHNHTTYSALWSDVLDALLFVREQEPRQEAEQPAADMEAINELRERKAAAFLGGDTDSYLTLFTEDCVVLPPDASRIRGRDALRSWLEGMHQEFALSGGSIEPVYTFVVGDWAWELYRFAMAVAPRAGGEAVQERYRGLHHYRRQPDGTWRIAQDAWNAVAAGGGR